MTPAAWMPWIVGAISAPVKYGSGEKPSCMEVSIGQHLFEGSRPHPISAALWGSAKGSTDRAQLDVNALVSVLRAHCIAAGIGHISTPCCCDVDARRERRHVVRWDGAVSSY